MANLNAYPLLRATSAAVTLALACVVLGSAHAEEVQHTRAADMKGMVATLVNGRGFGLIRTGDNYLVMTAVRAVPGDPELHEGMADLFIVQEGSADIRVGGRLVDGKPTGPGEWLGGRVEGGKVTSVAPGDILWIPAGEPHQVTPSGAQPFRYMVVKIAKAATSAPAAKAAK